MRRRIGGGVAHGCTGRGSVSRRSRTRSLRSAPRRRRRRPGCAPAAARADTRTPSGRPRPAALRILLPPTRHARLRTKPPTPSRLASRRHVSRNRRPARGPRPSRDGAPHGQWAPRPVSLAHASRRCLGRSPDECPLPAPPLTLSTRRGQGSEIKLCPRRTAQCCASVLVTAGQRAPNPVRPRRRVSGPGAMPSRRPARSRRRWRTPTQIAATM